MKKTILLGIVLILLASIVSANDFSIIKEKSEWNNVQRTGDQADLTFWTLSKDTKKTEIGWIPDSGNCIGHQDTYIYDQNNNQVLDDKNKPIKLKCETSKCGGQDCYHISLTAAQAINIDNFIKLGNQSSVSIYEQSSMVNYVTDNFEVNVTLRKWNSQDFVIAPSEIFISHDENTTKYKFGANDTVAKQDTLYQYEWKSSKNIQKKDNFYYLDQRPLSKKPFYRVYEYERIDTSDICTNLANCSYSLINNTLKVNFTGFYNETLDMVFIDPAFDLTYDSADDLIFTNATTAYNYGASLSGPNIYMNFNNPPGGALTDFENYRTYSDGKYVEDNSLNNNYGTKSGVISSELFWVDGNVSGEQALEFDGTGDVRSSSSISNGANAFTVSFWIVKPSSSSEVPFVHGTPDRVIQIFGSNALTCRALQSGTVWVGRSGSIGVTDGNWHHFACTYNGTADASAVRSYVDNVRSDVADDTNGAFTSLNSNANTVLIGSQGSSQLDGKMNHVMYFNRSLNATEIEWIYTNQSVGEKSTLNSDPSLMHYWALNESSGYVATDYVGGVDADLTNYPEDTNPVWNSTGGYDGSGAYEFDGIGEGDFIEIADISVADGEDITISMYANFKTTGGHLLGNSATANDLLALYTNAIVLRTGSVSTGTFILSPTISVGSWNHIVYIRKDGVGRAYANGIESTTGGVTQAGSITFDWIGKRTGTPLKPFNGSIDQIQIWDRALSADEVLNLYNGTPNGSNYIGKYKHKGDFKSKVFYNENNSNWNLTLNVVTGNSTKTIYDILGIEEESAANATWTMSYKEDNRNRSAVLCEDSSFITNSESVCISRTGAPLPGCSAAENYTDAKAWCEAAGARLCTMYEVQSTLTFGGGCSMNNINVWTSTSCGDGKHWIMEDNDRPYQAQCTDDSTSVKTVCCLDFNNSMFLSDNSGWQMNKDTQGLTGGSGPSGKGVSFIDDGAEIELGAEWNGGTLLAFSTWYYSDVPDALTYILNQGAATDHNYLHHQADGTFLWEVKDSAETTKVETTETYPWSQWYHIFVQINGTDESVLYINGERVANVSTNMGGMGTSSDEPNLGEPGVRLSDTRFYWNRIFTDAKVKEIYEYDLTKMANLNITLQSRTGSDYNTSDENLRVLYSLEDENVTFTNLGGNRNFTVNGNALFNQNSGIVGKGLYCDGSGDYLNTTSPFSTGIGRINTVSIWFRAETEKANMALFSSGNALAESNPFFLVRVNSGTLESWTGGGYATLKTGIEQNRWYHLVIQRNSATVTVWVDGVQEATYGTATTGNNKQFFICGGFNAQWKGKVDEVRIYNGTLTLAKVQNLYNLGSAHINWSDWTDNGLVQDETETNLSGTGKFMQYRAFLNSDNTNVTPILVNYSVTTSNVITNTAPSTELVFINSTDGSNYSNQDISCYANITDADADTVYANFTWYKNNVSDSTGQTLVELNNISLVSTLSSTNLTADDIWTCGVLAYDLTDYATTEVNATITILAVPSTPSAGEASPSDDASNPQFSDEEEVSEEFFPGNRTIITKVTDAMSELKELIFELKDLPSLSNKWKNIPKETKIIIFVMIGIIVIFIILMIWVGIKLTSDPNKKKKKKPPEKDIFD